MPTIDLKQLTPRQLGVLLRLGDPKAVRHVTRALTATGGDVRAAAERLGLPREETLHEWLSSVPSLESAPRAGIAAAHRANRKATSPAKK